MSTLPPSEPVAKDRLVILSNDDGLVVAGLVGAERIIVAWDPVAPLSADRPSA